MSSSEYKSEIAYIRRQIDLEYEATQQALHGLASGTARHDVIYAKMERIGAYHKQLIPLVGEDAADDLLCEANDKSFERFEQAQQKKR